VNKQLQGDQSQVKTLTSQANTDFAKERKAYESWQCEIDGQTCDGASGVIGNGAQAHGDYLAYVQARNNYRAAAAALRAAQTTASKDQHSFARYQKQRLQHLQAQARKALPGLQREYNALEAKIQRTIATGDVVNEANTGILAQLQALSQASAANSSLAAARWTVLALFFVIEILPVTVKALLNLGSQTSYERVAIGREEHITDREDMRRNEQRRIDEDESEARIEKVKDRIRLGKIDSETQLKIAQSKAESRFKVQEDMREREQGIGKRANQYVADQMTDIIDSALQEWGDRIRATLLNGGAHSRVASSNGQHTGRDAQDGQDSGAERESHAEGESGADRGSEADHEFHGEQDSHAEQEAYAEHGYDLPGEEKI
jgi:hypothetical protein